MTMSNNTYNPNPNLRQILPSSGVYSPEEYANALIQNRNSQPLIRTPGALAANLAAAAINHLVPNPAGGPVAGAFQNHLGDFSQYAPADPDNPLPPGAFNPGGWR